MGEDGAGATTTHPASNAGLMSRRVVCRGGRLGDRGRNAVLTNGPGSRLGRSPDREIATGHIHTVIDVRALIPQPVRVTRLDAGTER